MTRECEHGDHELCDGLIDSQQGCICPCHNEEDGELFGEDEDGDR